MVITLIPINVHKSYKSYFHCIASRFFTIIHIFNYDNAMNNSHTSPEVKEEGDGGGGAFS